MCFPIPFPAVARSFGVEIEWPLRLASGTILRLACGMASALAAARQPRAAGRQAGLGCQHGLPAWGRV